ncbi:N-6 DNA methylase [Nocardia macrotermitis]|nr:N-6 DNA methylase [Nocardia macrotermitis]
MTATEISKLAGVTRATVSNWRRRHEDFPQPVGGTEARPVFDRNEVQSWLSSRGTDISESPLSRLRTAVRSSLTADESVEVAKLLVHPAGSTSPDQASDAVSRILKAARAIVPSEGLAAVADVLTESALTEPGTYATAEPVAELMVTLAAAGTPIDTVLDPACGSGYLLLAAAREGATGLFGQDVLAVQATRARLLIGAEIEKQPEIEVGDSLLADAFAGKGFDVVLCDPPGSGAAPSEDDLALGDPRLAYGIPPKSEAELAWALQSLVHARIGGYAVLLLSPGAASRPTGRRIRSALLRAGAVRAVIALPQRVAQPWAFSLHLWVLQGPDPSTRPGHTVLFIDTESLGADGAVDWPTVEETITTAWRSFLRPRSRPIAVPGLVAEVDVIGLLDDTVNLAPSAWMSSSLDPETMAGEATAALSDLESTVAELAAAVTAVDTFEPAVTDWRTATVLELVNGGALHWFPPGTTGVDSGGDHAVWRTIEHRDIARGTGPSGTVRLDNPDSQLIVQPDDILLAPLPKSSTHTDLRLKVAGPDDVGALPGRGVAILRAVPDRTDPWFLAAFVAEGDGLPTGTTSWIRGDRLRTRIPLLAMAQQRRCGAAYRRIYEVHLASARVTAEVRKATDLLTGGLTAGVLVPAADDTNDNNFRGGNA